MLRLHTEFQLAAYSEGFQAAGGVRVVCGLVLDFVGVNSAVFVPETKVSLDLDMQKPSRKTAVLIILIGIDAGGARSRLQCQHAEACELSRRTRRGICRLGC